MMSPVAAKVDMLRRPSCSPSCLMARQRAMASHRMVRSNAARKEKRNGLLGGGASTVEEEMKKEMVKELYVSKERRTDETSLRRLLAKETLARRYYELNLPGVCVHFAYLRKPLQYLCIDPKSSSAEEVLIGGSKSKPDRTEDFLHFQLLGSEMAGGTFFEYPIASSDKNVEDDLQVTIEVDREFLGQSTTDAGADHGTAGNGLDSNDNGIDGMPSIEDEQRRVISRKVPIRIRYQQFTEFSSYTFELPYFETRDPLSTKECFEQGEGLIKALKGLDGWWDDIPGELFLVAIVASTPAESKGNKIVACPKKIQTDLHHIQSDSRYPGDTPVGAMVGEMEKEMGLFVNYALQPFTNHLYVSVPFNENASTLDCQLYSRNIQRFLELEQYRLLCLSAVSTAKYLFIALESINSELLGVLGTFKSSDLSIPAKKDALESIIDLQSRCETLGIGIRDRFGASEAYANVVFRRLDKLATRRADGVKDFEGFVKKRLEPAIRTYKSSGQRLDETTDAVSRASNLLRCQVDLDVQQQNDKLLILGTIISVTSFSLTIIQFLDKANLLPDSKGFSLF